jgi:hypothetical protein
MSIEGIGFYIVWIYYFVCGRGGFAKKLNRSGGSRVIGGRWFGRGGFTDGLVNWRSIRYLTGSRIHAGHIAHPSGMNPGDGKKREDAILEDTSYRQFIRVAN